MLHSKYQINTSFSGFLVAGIKTIGFQTTRHIFHRIEWIWVHCIFVCSIFRNSTDLFNSGTFMIIDETINPSSMPSQTNNHSFAIQQKLLNVDINTHYHTFIHSRSTISNKNQKMKISLISQTIHRHRWYRQTHGVMVCEELIALVSIVSAQHSYKCKLFVCQFTDCCGCEIQPFTKIESLCFIYSNIMNLTTARIFKCQTKFAEIHVQT